MFAELTVSNKSRGEGRNKKAEETDFSIKYRLLAMTALPY